MRSFAFLVPLLFLLTTAPLAHALEAPEEPDEEVSATAFESYFARRPCRVATVVQPLLVSPCYMETNGRILTSAADCSPTACDVTIVAEVFGFANTPFVGPTSVATTARGGGLARPICSASSPLTQVALQVPFYYCEGIAVLPVAKAAGSGCTTFSIGATFARGVVVFHAATTTQVELCRPPGQTEPTLRIVRQS